MSNIKRFIEENGLSSLEDNKNYKNRFEVKSETSNSVYVIAQTKKNGIWTCECFGFRRHRHCKHLDSVKGLIEDINAESEHLQLENK